MPKCFVTLNILRINKKDFKRNKFAYSCINGLCIYF